MLLDKQCIKIEVSGQWYGDVPQQQLDSYLKIISDTVSAYGFSLPNQLKTAFRQAELPIPPGFSVSLD